MALAAQAALLDELMGRSRNETSVSQDVIKWYNDDVCKHFLAGFCPNDIFINTKADMGPCENLHDTKLFEEYRRSKNCRKMGYEKKLIRFLEKLISDADRRILSNKRRLKVNGSTVIGGIVVERKKQIEELNIKIESILKEVEALGIQGKICESQAKMVECEDLQREKRFFENDIELHVNNAKEMEVCEICGAMQVKNDMELRVKEHEAGRMHLGFIKVRETLHQMEKEMQTNEDVYENYIEYYADYGRSNDYLQEFRPSRHAEYQQFPPQRESRHHRHRSRHRSRSHERRSRHRKHF